MLIDIPQLREKVRVFRDRSDAGEKLAGMLSDYKDSSAVVLAMPAGGVPVAAVMAEKLGLGLDVAVVSKVTLPWNSETGFGAVAFDGTVCLNEKMLEGLPLSKEQVRERIKFTREKVAARLKKFRSDRELPDLSGKTVLLVDDGIASGFTMMTAVKATAKLGAKQIVIIVPTGHSESLAKISKISTTIYCANVRSGYSFAVADAYEKWSDISEDEAAEILRRFNRV